MNSGLLAADANVERTMGFYGVRKSTQKNGFSPLEVSRMRDPAPMGSRSSHDPMA